MFVHIELDIIFVKNLFFFYLEEFPKDVMFCLEQFLSFFILSFFLSFGSINNRDRFLESIVFLRRKLNDSVKVVTLRSRISCFHSDGTE